MIDDIKLVGVDVQRTADLSDALKRASDAVVLTINGVALATGTEFSYAAAQAHSDALEELRSAQRRELQIEGSFECPGQDFRELLALLRPHRTSYWIRREAWSLRRARASSRRLVKLIAALLRRPNRATQAAVARWFDAHCRKRDL